MALVVITGGARSGKSAIAAELARERECTGSSVCYAVFGRPDIDAEFAERIERHRAERPAAWRTIEAADARSWLDSVSDGELLVLDCLGTLVGLAMEESYHALGDTVLGDADANALPSGFEASVTALIEGVVGGILERAGDTIVVTNEVGDGIVPGYASGRLFRDELGRANRRLVSAADAAYLCVAGRVIELASRPKHATWPED